VALEKCRAVEAEATTESVAVVVVVPIRDRCEGDGGCGGCSIQTWS
jgi:hypothetical protein